MVFRPAGNLAGRKEHALQEMTSALEVQPFLAADLGRRSKTDGQDKLNEIHKSTCVRLASLTAAPAGAEQPIDGEGSPDALSRNRAENYAFRF